MPRVPPWSRRSAAPAALLTSRRQCGRHCPLLARRMTRRMSLRASVPGCVGAAAGAGSRARRETARAARSAPYSPLAQLRFGAAACVSCGCVRRCLRLEASLARPSVAKSASLLQAPGSPLKACFKSLAHWARAGCCRRPVPCRLQLSSTSRGGRGVKARFRRSLFYKQARKSNSCGGTM